jgi:hypothetical protein
MLKERQMVPERFVNLSFLRIPQVYLTRELLLKGKDQYGLTPCANLFRCVTFNTFLQNNEP